MKKEFYITTTLPYVNAEPHVGFASEIVLADVRARFERILGKEVIFNTGTDEHGLKIWQKAREAGVEAQDYVDEYAAKFDDLKEMLELSYTNFIRTTDENHKKAAQELWKRVDDNGYIYKKQYKVKYCVGCELEKTDSELVDRYCPLHPGKELEIIEEENYFFKFSALQDKLLELYKNNPEFVVPNKRFNEIKSFVERGLEDFSISRLKTKMPWGVPVPNDDDQVMYVWFDALTNYISTLGWPGNQENFEKFWGTVDAPNAIQIAGKDNLRQQSAMWQAMLLAAELPTSKQVFINGFIGVDGQKMSKSIGNVISPTEMVENFGIDGTRYLLLTKGTFGEDNDISWEKMTAKYNADLANGLGNLTSRVIKLSENLNLEIEKKEIIFDEASIKLVESFDLDKVLENIWLIVREDNKYIEDTKPWELAKNNEDEFKKVMKKLIEDLNFISELLIPFMPETSEKIKKALETKERVILFERMR
ncbi:MAG: Methionine-tRNA ligase [Candidatus Moranbacteria bacterium GW2011_GWE1_35_17]|nr:MAG: Methionine-tRNA ligase [Candidatus Moranbacteria bacterium GW2011_GWE1_35_17]KKP72252.1 MAG: Methionine-tRNA ligase [Candidatus Moranbacteria bacterium GW2011_GWE2_35_164]KKP82428.1 MAG: Methionine-tRNA ligase [Candidatus Moranbacteria bacterium GW2011_GWF1_35_5]KKP84289.1 MAG: Methionine-tRNA ligase [Candidatus Moranbacteria bacterium GW2011_GWF2_35_54]